MIGFSALHETQNVLPLSQKPNIESYPESYKVSPNPQTLLNFRGCTVHSDIHTVHSPTDAHLLER